MSKKINTADYQKAIKEAESFFEKAAIASNPPLHLEAAAKNLGIDVRYAELKGDVSGFLFLTPGEKPIIGVNKNHPPTRQRFTIAHELGHLFLHAPNEEDSSFIDKEIFALNRNDISASGTDKKEIEANFFAAEILMPADKLYKDVATLNHSMTKTELYRALAEKYQVSEEAIKFRLKNLKLIFGGK